MTKSRFNCVMLMLGMLGWSVVAASFLSGCEDCSHISVRPADNLQSIVCRVREARRTGKIPLEQVVSLELSEGIYRISQPLALTAEDSHLRVIADKTGDVVISGGFELPAFVEHRNGVWRTKVPVGCRFDQLWVNGRFATRARMPNEGFAFMQSPCEESVDPKSGKVVDQSKKAFVSGVKEAAALAEEERNGNLGRAFVRVYQLWVMGLHRIISFDSKDRIVKVAPDTERPMLNGWGLTTRYVLENLRVALDAPGEWYHDVASGELLYMPRHGERIEETRAVIPMTMKLLQVNGSDIVFKGVTFADCGYDLSRGVLGVQAQYEAPAAVAVSDSESVDFISCSFLRLAPVCLRIGEGCRHVTVQGSLFEEFGVGGIHIGNSSRKNRPTSSVSVTDTFIRGGGRILEGGVGVWIGFASDIDVCHNEICDLGYTGISSGWVWGYAETPTARIRLNDNYIHDLGYCVLSDMGGIYTLGKHPGSEVIGNHIHDIWSSDVDGRGAWGLYADEGTSGIRFESNLVYRTKTGSFHQHFGKDNIVRNNIFAYAREYPVERTRIEDHQSFVCENNIVIWTNKTQAVRSRQDGDLKKTTKGLVFDRNIYFNPNGVDEQAFHGFSFSDWQASGMDKCGLVADPRLKDPVNGEWMPDKDSPVWRLGFRAFDPKVAGVRATTADPAWAGLRRLKYRKPTLSDPLPLTHRDSYWNDFEGYEKDALPKSFKYQCPRNSEGKGGVRIVPVADVHRGYVLEFADAAGLPQRGVPHVSGYFGATNGVYKVAFSICAEKGAEMDFSVRGETPDFPFGVLIRYADEKISVNGEVLVGVPVGAWWRLSVTTDLSEPVRHWQVVVEKDGVKLASTIVASKDPKCVFPGWFGWNSNAESDVKFWVDDVEVQTECKKGCGVQCGSREK